MISPTTISQREECELGNVVEGACRRMKAKAQQSPKTGDGRGDGAWASSSPEASSEPPVSRVPEPNLPLEFSAVCGNRFPFLFKPVCVGFVSLKTSRVLTDTLAEE